MSNPSMWFCDVNFQSWNQCNSKLLHIGACFGFPCGNYFWSWSFFFWWKRAFISVFYLSFSSQRFEAAQRADFIARRVGQSSSDDIRFRVVQKIGGRPGVLLPQVGGCRHGRLDRPGDAGNEPKNGKNKHCHEKSSCKKPENILQLGFLGRIGLWKSLRCLSSLWHGIPQPSRANFTACIRACEQPSLWFSAGIFLFFSTDMLGGHFLSWLCVLLCFDGREASFWWFSPTTI